MLCKRTGKLVGFEEFNLSADLNMRPEDLDNDTEEEKIKEDSSSESRDSDSAASDHDDSSSETEELSCETLPSKKAKLIFQFFFSSLERDFSWPVASFPLHKINHRVLSSIVWQVCEAIGGLNCHNGKKIEVLYGTSDGSTYSLAFF